MRASGILMGISSVPSKYGIGCFSKEAYDFVDQLKMAGQHIPNQIYADLLLQMMHIWPCLI